MNVLEQLMFQQRVSEMLQSVDKVRQHIMLHDFSLAELEARELAGCCSSTNRFANRLADKED